MDDLKDIREKQPAVVIIVTVIGGLILLLPPLYSIAMIVVGANFMNSCPAQQFIPVWCVVEGVLTLFVTVVFLAFFIPLLFIKKQKNLLTVIATIIIGIVLIVMLGFFCAGNITIYSISKTVDYDNTASSSYCNKTLYMFAYVSIILEFVWLALVVFTIVSLALLFIILAFRNSRSRS